MSKYFFLNLFCSLSALAQAPRCMDTNTDDVDKFLNEKMSEVALHPTAIPEFLLLRNDIEFTFNSDGSLERKIFSEGFLKFEADSYRIIPGLGLTLEASKDSLFYVCVQMSGRRSSNFLRIIHLERGGLLSRRFHTQPIPLKLKPFNEGVLLLGGMMKTLGIADPKKADRKQPVSIDNAVNSLFHMVFKLGVEQVDIRPKEFELTLVSQFFHSIDIARTRKKFPLKADWLVSDQ